MICSDFGYRSSDLGLSLAKVLKLRARAVILAGGDPVQ
jgi:hypothetical protein